jgi:hypothetical protein
MSGMVTFGTCAFGRVPLVFMCEILREHLSAGRSLQSPWRGTEKKDIYVRSTE